MLNDPSYVFNYFIRDSKMMKIYAQNLGYELSLKKDKSSSLKYDYKQFKQLLLNRIDKKHNYEVIFSAFFEEIDAIIKSMD